MDTYLIEIVLPTAFAVDLLGTGYSSNEKKRFQPCVNRKDVLTEWIVTGVATSALFR
jgi:hypothetical protein